MIGEPLPPLYAKWTAEFLGGSIPRETQATCDTCAMCAGVGDDSPSRGYFFNPLQKCCTYLPELHNFLVGRILADDDPATQAGRATVEKRIANAVGVTPLGLMHTPVFSVLHGRSQKAFGRNSALLCPHYVEDGGRCGVWRNRESVCATWFCKHVRGQVGDTFWRSLHSTLAAVEKSLARWCLLELDLGDEALRQVMAIAEGGKASEVTAESLDNKVEQETYDRSWGSWRGREHLFFRRCAELVSPLSWTDVLAICGPNVGVHVRLTQDSYRQLTGDDIPLALTVGSFQIIQMRAETTRVCTYSVYDPLDVPNALLEVLHYFDGRPTEAALAAIQAEQDLRIHPGLVRKMVDFMLLVPVDKGAIAASE